MRLSILSLLLSLLSVSGSSNTCEKIDGDCPDSCSDAGYAGTQNFNALIQISPFNPSLSLSASKAEKYIKQNDHVQSVDNPWMSLHTTLYYFCCYTENEKKEILKGMKDVTWDSLKVSYDTFGCNLDHDNETIYLHGMPSNQDDLFSLARKIEEVIESTGAHVIPRETLFHMTLARVDVDYPVDDVVEYFLNEGVNFGEIEVNSFHVNGHLFHASN
ncbi:hypothetical protein TrLO_g9508 [Triparma laevis f. longispina]|uniref:Uncharacterized protein n=1 Tax=Triparma laevis f. longispina TaxID=1714387 RepID=A0A9W7F2H3_9STRA|nr:hypothetical protein TrLO_g9508 [Triparma laevis f. longispina]